MFEVAIGVLVLCVAFLTGRVIEGRHYQALRQREQLYHDITMHGARAVPNTTIDYVALVCGNTVIAMDGFRRFVMSIRAIFGGRIPGVESLMARARREAVLRMKAQARVHGCQTILNVRITTTSLLTSDRLAGRVEVLAYGTAVRHAH